MPHIFIDRDGVLNEYLSKDYVKSPQEWVWIPNAIKGLKILKELNYKIYIVSNQSCINRKIISWKTINAINSQLRRQLLKEKIYIEEIIICPHINEDLCSCRKPKPGMLNTLMQIYQMDKQDIFFAGDSISDLDAGKNANIKVVGLASGNPNMATSKRTNIKQYKSLYRLARQLQGSLKP